MGGRVRTGNKASSAGVGAELGNFDSLTDQEKLKIVLNTNANIKPTANFILSAFEARSIILFA